jgi:hypothetical protein
LNEYSRDQCNNRSTIFIDFENTWPGYDQTQNRSGIHVPHSTWWPVHLPTGQHVQMDMKYGLSTVAVAVHHQAVAIFRKSQILCEMASYNKQLAKQVGIICIGIIDRGNVASWNNEDMVFRLRMNIPERNDVYVFIDNVRIQFTIGNLAKQAFHWLFSLFFDNHLVASSYDDVLELTSSD